MCLTKYANLYYLKYDGGFETADLFHFELCFIYLDMYVLTCEIDVWINTPIDNDTSDVNALLFYLDMYVLTCTLDVWMTESKTNRVVTALM